MSETDKIEWLKKNALFSCKYENCAEECSFHYDQLSCSQMDGLPICEYCYDAVERTEDAPSFGKLAAFYPFPAPSALEAENARLREALDAITHMFGTNPSDACADMPEADYMHLYLGNVRAFARETLEASHDR